MPITDDEKYYITSCDEDLWRYVGFDHFLDILRTEKLLFRRISNFDDPYEGTVPNAYVQLRENEYEDSDEWDDDITEILSSLTEFIGKSSYGNCWHRNDKESASMWEHYGDRGIAIVSDPSSLVTGFEKDDRDLFSRPVEYLNFYSDFEELSNDERDKLEDFADEASSELVSPLFIKRRSFSHENELRIIYCDLDIISEEEFESVDYNIVYEKEGETKRKKFPLLTYINGETGVVNACKTPEDPTKHIEIRATDVINQIRVAPQADDWFYNTVCEAVDSMGPDDLTSDDVRRSDTDKHEPIH
ncbi:DUF2971 domain-containing protein [Natronolimnobius sp. AArcel1]|uniref:DUF2971 domain-containing protein n=1 Tax=Natronolimnobius sp. AArcel1 TaxID=1679093 RepID=UPI0013ED4F0E|nr:DUF2971 domain-containing protein [Natronolimnobius sp. AArcel1]NGM68788.1 DUF2971 domain-containing protein [Natronolimnobius sp. AArcel1]